MLKKSGLLAALLGVSASVALATPAFAASYVVNLQNKDATGSMVFSPALTRVAVGDSVTFKAVNQGHMVQSLPDIAPAGAPMVRGSFGRDVTVTFTKEGVYGFKCLPHYAMGMVALVVVGKPVNEAAAKAAHNPPQAQKRLDTLFAQIDAKS